MSNKVEKVETVSPSYWERLADKALKGEIFTKEEASQVLQAPDDQILPLLQAAYRVRKHYYGNKVKLNMIINAKSGLCPEDCGYCSQSIVSEAPIEKYTLLDKETLLAGAREAMERKAGTYCIVASGRGASDKEIDQVVEVVKEIRISGGREVNLRSLQVMGLYAANSIFVGDYLTTEGQNATADHQMIEDLGFEIEECAL